MGFPGGTSGKEPTCQFRRHKRCGFNPWVGKISWRREWQPTPVFSPGESHGQRSLAGYSPWGHKELDMTERLNNTKLHLLITWCSILLMLHNIFNHFLYLLFSTFCYYKQCCNEQPIHTLVCLSVLYTCLSIE